MNQSQKDIESRLYNGIDYATKDEFTHRLDHDGIATIKSTSYKCITWGDNQVPAIERIDKGNKEIIVGSRGETFRSRIHSINWALYDIEIKGLI